MGKWEHVGGDINWYNDFGEQFTVSNKDVRIIQPRISVSRLLP